MTNQAQPANWHMKMKNDCKEASTSIIDCFEDTEALEVLTHA